MCKQKINFLTKSIKYYIYRNIQLLQTYYQIYIIVFRPLNDRLIDYITINY